MKRAGRPVPSFSISLLLVFAALAAPAAVPGATVILRRVLTDSRRTRSRKIGPPYTAKTPALGGDTIWTYRVPTATKIWTRWICPITNAANEAASLIGKAQDGPKPTSIAIAAPRRSTSKKS